MSIAQQCELLGLARSTYYYEPVPESAENLLLMRLLDGQNTRTPFYRALRVATPEIFNTDQGVQFTSAEFTTRLKAADVRISWDGRGRALDNIFVERLWRSVKYEEVYIKKYQSVPEAVSNRRSYFTFYNQERLHQALAYQTPARVYGGKEASSE